MARNLVIVESPAKVKTIRKFLGSTYTVMASQGHVRDLPKSQMGIDVAADFEPRYITIRGKGDLLAKLRKEAKAADKVYLATDPDREGEAISWHLLAALGLEEKKAKRITFNEITKGAVKDSFAHAREIDMQLVDAQQARRILDRLVGYSISPVLWIKVKRGLSAGRVQSAALRIIADREEEIEAFIPEEYWTLEAVFLVEKDKAAITAKYYGSNGKKKTIAGKEELDDILKDLQGAAYSICEVKRGERTKKAPLPFTTSTLQQEANKVLGFPTGKTMRIAQQLYEGVDIPGQGTTALITYLRTDSTRISETADAAAKAYIQQVYGQEYVQRHVAGGAAKGRIQDAHEAIRPTDITREPQALKEALSRDQLRLYQLIWKRFTASRMAHAVYETAQVKIEARGHLFTASSAKLVSPGFLSVYRTEEDGKEGNLLPDSLTEDSELTFQNFSYEQHFTQPPAHFTEAALVKALEELGVGRPSTYAPTIATLLARHYVTKEGKSLFMTEMGQVVNRLVKQSFPEIVDVHFTAHMEEQLDLVEEGTVFWKQVLRDFYPTFHEEVEKAQKELEKVQVADEETEEVCEKCGRHMVIKYGPHGKFLACPGFPECRNTKPFLEKIGVSCPQCGGELVLRRTRKGRIYYGCEKYPDCEFTSWQRPLAEKCPVCGAYMVQKGKRTVCSDPHCGTIKKE